MALAHRDPLKEQDGWTAPTDIWRPALAGESRFERFARFARKLRNGLALRGGYLSRTLADLGRNAESDLWRTGRHTSPLRSVWMTRGWFCSRLEAKLQTVF